MERADAGPLAAAGAFRRNPLAHQIAQSGPIFDLSEPLRPDHVRLTQAAISSSRSVFVSGAAAGRSRSARRSRSVQDRDERRRLVQEQGRGSFGDLPRFPRSGSAFASAAAASRSRSARRSRCHCATSLLNQTTAFLPILNPFGNSFRFSSLSICIRLKGTYRRS